MPIDLATEAVRALAEAAGRLPPVRASRPVSPSTVWRWATRGVRSRNGVVVRLETIKIGGTCCTSDQALVRFFLALTEGATQPAGPVRSQPAPRTTPGAVGG
jgi:hypothetical protein